MGDLSNVKIQSIYFFEKMKRMLYTFHLDFFRHSVKVHLSSFFLQSNAVFFNNFIPSAIKKKTSKRLEMPPIWLGLQLGGSHALWHWEAIRGLEELGRGRVPPGKWAPCSCPPPSAETCNTASPSPQYWDYATFRVFSGTRCNFV